MNRNSNIDSVTAIQLVDDVLTLRKIHRKQLWFTKCPKYKKASLPLLFDTQMLKSFQLQAALPFWPLTRDSAPGPARGSTPILPL